MAKEKILVQIDDQVIELKGEELEAFNKDRFEIQTELKAQKAQLETQKALKVSAYTKLGLTEEEINAIL
jgi:hypothetical protein